MECLVPLTYYELTFREPQLGLIVSRDMPLRVLGFKPVKFGPGTAERSGRVHKGDIISVADGRDLRQMSRADAVDTIASKRPIVIGFSVGDAMVMSEGAGIGGTPGGSGVARLGGAADGGEPSDE